MKRSRPALVIAGLVLACGLAASSAWLADDSPDGLSTVAREEGFAGRGTGHALEDSPVAGYSIDEIEDEGMGTAAAGLLGVLLTFLIAAGAAGVARSLRKRTTAGDGQ